MRRHDAGQALVGQALERDAIELEDVLAVARIDRALVVRVRCDAAVSREMLADGRHAGLPHATHDRRAEPRDRVGVVVEGAVADNRADIAAQIQHRRETQVDADGEQFRRQQPADRPRLGFGGVGVFVEALAETPHRRQRRKALAEALDAAAFLIDGDQ